MSIYAFIPARKGSERIKNKNKKKINEIPLIFYTFAQALSVFDAKKIYVSTDDKEILEWSKKLGFLEFGLRPGNISTANSPDISWLKYSLKIFEINNIPIKYICLLRPTSPFRSKSFIQTGLNLLIKNTSFSSLRAVRKCLEHPGKMWILKNNIMIPLLPFSEKNVPWHSMQYKSLPDIYVQTAALEILNVDKTVRMNQLSGDIVMPYFGNDMDNFDINNQNDLLEAENLILNYKNNITKKASILFNKM